MSDAGPVLLDPPDWAGLTNDQLTAFAEAVNVLLDFGIFRPPLAAELVRYRDAVADQVSARIARLPGPPGPAGPPQVTGPGPGPGSRPMAPCGREPAPPPARPGHPPAQETGP